MSYKRSSPTAFYHAKELRLNQTPAEKKLWAHLRARRLTGLRFRRQHALGPFIVVFCCPEKRFTIELDGASHTDQVEYDQSRAEWLNERGWRELRFTNRDVENNTEAVVEPHPLSPLQKKSAFGEGSLTPSLSPFLRWRGLG